MVAEAKRLVWSNLAKQQLKEAYNFIYRSSPASAEKVTKEITKLTEGLIANPERFGRDKYKLNNNGSYRAFEKHHYRVSYQILDAEIRILRVRHTSMKPKNY